MEPQEFIEILKQAGKLKTTMRHCWLTMPDQDAEAEPENLSETGERVRRESVAEHSWRLALMAMLLAGEKAFEGTDLNKVIRMCLLHDLGETFTGDVPAFLKTDGDTDSEKYVYRQWVGHFPEPQRSEWLGLLVEMDALTTQEAKVYKALDNLEALIAHNESDISTWLPLEYNLQYTYGKKNMACSPYFEEVRKAVDDWTTEKIREEKE